jgi:hypothetical protein
MISAGHAGVTHQADVQAHDLAARVPPAVSAVRNRPVPADRGLRAAVRDRTSAAHAEAVSGSAAPADRSRPQERQARQALRLSAPWRRRLPLQTAATRA